LIDLKSK